jgi:molybdate transport repressor ModE-like protein
MTLLLTARWQSGAHDLDARLIPLLRAVGKEGSLNRAVAALRLSYRHAWGVLGKMERALGRKLVLMERGRGARLSAFAQQLIEADEKANALLHRELAQGLRGLNEGLSTPQIASRGKPLVVHASHDLALAELRDVLAASGRPIELHFRGSLDCLAGLARGECALAGFHVPDAPADRTAFAPFRALLKGRNLRLVSFVRRRQGLMVAPGNPRRLLTLGDLAARAARFVNRQPESGTRLCLDRLLAAARLRPDQIRGYEVEEFTHAAVAATVASGMADAGFGIEAAALRQGLDFVPLAGERYYLAARTSILAREDARALLMEMKSPPFLKRLQGFPGYDSRGIGELLSVKEALRAGIPAPRLPGP